MVKWRNRQSSNNVVDRRRGASARRVAGGGSILGIGIIVVGYLLGYDLRPVAQVVDQFQENRRSASGSEKPISENDERAKFVSVILADTEETFGALFAAAGSRYAEPKLVLFRGGVSSACGMQGSAVGPFYCPGDQQVYIDLSFFDELARNFGAPGDFAQAYVIAHEVGHHIQQVTGISQQVQRQKRGLPDVQKNMLSVKQELQADCYAGVWAHYAHRDRKMLEPGDLAEGLRAATAIGDDTIQKKARGYVSPESFTHGSGAQRVRWFKQGFSTGQIQSCDTFSSP